MCRPRAAALLSALLFFGPLCASWAFVGCSGRSGVRGSGRPAERTFELPPFHAVHAIGELALDVAVDSGGPAVLETDDNLLDLVAVEVSDGVLTIRPRASISPKTGVRFVASTERLDEVTTTGGVEVTLRGVEGESLRLSFTGAAKVRASGRVERLDLECRGAGSVDLRDLDAGTATVRVEGAASIRVRTSGPLEVHASGAARVVQYGEGPIEKRTTGLAVVTRSPGVGEADTRAERR